MAGGKNPVNVFCLQSNLVIVFQVRWFKKVKKKLLELLLFLFLLRKNLMNDER